MRILQGIGAHQAIIDDAPVPEDYVWFGSAGQEILRFPFSGPSASGFQSDYMIFQPVLDDALYASLEPFVADGSVELRLGAEVIEVDQTASRVLLNVAEMRKSESGRRVATGRRYPIAAQYAIAADGASSSTRSKLGIERSGPEIEERWYTVDLALLRDLPSTINGQWCDPSRPTYVGHLGKSHHRFEMKVLPHESEDKFDEEYTWELLAKWNVTPADAQIYRRVVYPFEAKLAQTWQVGRIFLAGDAAHTMPPFMGQGLCSGFRDSATLAWKLDLVLKALASPESLRSYETERRQHVAQWTTITNEVGAVSCVLDPVAASARDKAILADGLALSGPPSPGPGAFDAGEGRAPISPIGDLFPQATCEYLGVRGLLHDLVGDGFLVLTRVPDALSERSLEILTGINASVVCLGSNDLDSSSFYEDWLDQRGWSTVVVRPDYYVFGGAGDALVNELVENRLPAALQLTVNAAVGRAATV